MADYQGVMVIADQNGGKLANIAIEMLSAGRNLADQLGAPLCAVLFGAQAEGASQEAASFGADKVFILEDGSLQSFNSEAAAKLVGGLVEEVKPEIVLLGHTNNGKDLAGQLAARLNTGVNADVIGLSVDGGAIRQVKSIFGGNWITTSVTGSKPQIATIRPKAFDKAVPDGSRSAAVEKVGTTAGELRTKILEIVEETTSMVKLEEADIIVSGGRGLGSADGFAVIEALASTLGAAVGASRAAVDAGWKPHSFQVGQTGKTVKPKVYIACGISGALQHLAGMKSSDIIVAINKDPEAPIFQVATYGLVGDLYQIVPALNDEFKAALGK